MVQTRYYNLSSRKDIIHQRVERVVFSHGWQDKYEQLEFLCQFCKFQRNLAGWYFRSVKGEGQ